VTLKDGVKEILMEWAEMFPDGRIIVLVDESSCFPTSLGLIRDKAAEVRKKTEKLRSLLRTALSALDIVLPIYYLRAEYDVFENTHFFRPPRPGMVAWLQYRHRLDLDKCLYVYAEKSDLPSSLGLLNASSLDFLQTNGWKLASKMCT
jgi:hypothetical protein